MRLCEDSDTVATLVKLILAREGTAVVYAEDGEIGIAMCLKSTSDFDVVIRGIRMPLKDGCAMVARLRETG